MAKTKTAHGYELELKKMIKARTGVECEPWLLPQVRATANTMVMIDKIQAELEALPAMAAWEKGSTGQMTQKIDPRVPYYDKLQRTLMLQFESLGLNYKTTPSKVNENTKKGGEKQDRLKSLLESINDV